MRIDLRRLPLVVVFFMVAVAGFAILAEVGTWMYNQTLPVVAQPVTITGKRSETRNSGVKNHRHVTTSYYATFEFDQSHDRREFRMSGDDYAMLAEQDIGVLTYQGSRFKSFERRR